MYKTFVVGYYPKANAMAAALEKKANEVKQQGYNVLSFSITNSGKAILLTEKKAGSEN